MLYTNNTSVEETHRVVVFDACDSGRKLRRCAIQVSRVQKNKFEDISQKNRE